MRYTTVVDINVGRDRLIELFDSSENMKKWQPDLVSYAQMSGEPGQVGAKMELVYNMNNKEYKLVETITIKNFPEEFAATYETDKMWNLVTNQFYVLDDERTRWESVSEFKCQGFMRIMAFLMPSMFKKQTLKMMNNFKAFAEEAK